MAFIMGSQPMHTDSIYAMAQGYQYQDSIQISLPCVTASFDDVQPISLVYAVNKNKKTQSLAGLLGRRCSTYP